MDANKRAFLMGLTSKLGKELIKDVTDEEM